MNDPRNIFYRKANQLAELAKRGILEIAYKGNIGLHELVQFYMKANDQQIKKLEFLLQTNQIPQVIDLIELVTGTRLVV
jgi:hypothetical protein